VLKTCFKNEILSKKVLYLGHFYKIKKRKRVEC